MHACKVDRMLSLNESNRFWGKRHKRLPPEPGGLQRTVMAASSTSRSTIRAPLTAPAIKLQRLKSRPRNR